MNCAICDRELYFRWSDTHGVGVCSNCGLPYRLYHYDENDKRIEKGPEIAIKPEWVAIGKRYWDEKKRRVFPGTYDMGFLGHRSHTYSGATEEEMYEFDEWMKQHEAELPKAEGKE